MYIVFTDLDATLLDHETYSWQQARPAIQRLLEQGTPWLFATSKTRAETEYWRTEMGNQHPFIVENGGAAYFPRGYFPSPVANSTVRGNYEVLEWGTPYPDLVTALRKASHVARCPVRGFDDMTVQEVSAACRLPEALAALAKKREYDEPFQILDPARTEALRDAIISQRLACTRGGRFWHITGANDKGSAIKVLQRLYEDSEGPVFTVGIGDGLNDASMLNAVAVPILVSSAQLAELRRLVPRGILTCPAGPEGWNEVMLTVLAADL
jgi:mannosyl-3-phosphoglycerate phosphatase